MSNKLAESLRAGSCVYSRLLMMDKGTVRNM